MWRWGRNNKKSKMYFASKVQTLCVVLLTWGVALFEGNLPYFPIEISRTAASGPLAHGVFVWGIISILPTLLFETFFVRETVVVIFVGTAFENASSNVQQSMALVFGSPLLLWPIVLAVAWFDDTKHFWAHMTGVAMVIGLVCANVFLGGSIQRKLPVLVCALALFGLSSLMKGGAVVYVEMNEPVFDWRVPMRVVSNENNRLMDAVNTTFGVMYKGNVAGDFKEWETILPIFKVTGILQWLGFYLMASLY